MTTENNLLYLQAERHHDERRGWHEELMSINNEWKNNPRRLLMATLMLRPFIEFAILVMLLLIYLHR